ncbi:ribonuclease T2 family protein [Sphingomonas sp. GlSt437]|uniref:ribonuclease T2 family protein n=1 Tax=Sphingomonas sp. GlSt437 TaxID=3389970 RepID=UPI003A8548DF
MRTTRRAAIIMSAAASLSLPAAANAQALACRVPTTIPVPHADLPSAEQPRRVVPIGGYTLAITWAPEYCQRAKTDPLASFECTSGNRFGFALHGLWPDGEGPEWPQYCKATALLPPAIIKSTLCSTPSAQLIQHEWAKHGTCTGLTPNEYFTQSTRLYARLRYPNMSALSRKPGVTAGDVAKAIAGANPGISADMMRVTANKKGWLDEIWLCLDKALGYRACPAHQGGLAPDSPIKIWRGR